MKKKLIYIIIILGFILFALGFVLMHKNKENVKNSIEIIDATYVCDNIPFEFYSDSDYSYYFSCNKSNSLYVKYENGNKELIIDALNNNNVTIKMLQEAGLEFYKKER